VIIYQSFNHEGSRESVSGLTETGPSDASVNQHLAVEEDIRDTSSLLGHGIAFPASNPYNKIAKNHVNIITLSNSEALQSSYNLMKPDTENKYINEIAEMNAGSILPPDKDESLISMEYDTLKAADKKLLKPVAEEQGRDISATPEISSGKTKFMAGLSGMMAHVDGTETSTPGMSVGFYLEHKISRRISFRPGLAVAMNSLGISNSRNSSAFAYASSVVSGMNGTPESFKGQFSVVSMEVPLNVVFKLVERKGSSVYISAGASTVIYLSEHFTGEFVNKTTQEKVDAGTGMTYTEIKYSSVSVENEYSAFSRTDYFGLASISAGYSLPFAQTATLRIEPFIQFPLDDLTSLDLHVYYTGISLKMSLGRNSH
jgi:hypothetical protein